MKLKVKKESVAGYKCDQWVEFIGIAEPNNVEVLAFVRMCGTGEGVTVPLDAIIGFEITAGVCLSFKFARQEIMRINGILG